MGVLSYIGLSHPHFAIHILLGLFSRFGLTVLILPFPLVNHFSGSDNLCSMAVGELRKYAVRRHLKT